MMDENEELGCHLTSAVAFVEGGVQDACDDACSICLEAFCDNDPSTVTSCKHEFHLQCILEWGQRSSQCPMCWQPLSLKDTTSQELLDTVERERSIRFKQTRNATIIHHPTLGDFELQHIPVGSSDAELEERIIQHLAAAAAMGRAHHLARRDGQRGRMTSQGRQQFLVFSTHPNAPPVSMALTQRDSANEHAPVLAVPTPVPPTDEVAPRSVHELPEPEQIIGTAYRRNAVSNRFHSIRNSASPSSPVTQDRAGPSDLQSLSESLRSRLNAVSVRYKESILKSTRGWKERLFSRNAAVSELGSEGGGDANSGIAGVSCKVEHSDTQRNNGRSISASASHQTDEQMMTGICSPSSPENSHGCCPPNEDNTSTSGASALSPD